MEVARAKINLDHRILILPTTDATIERDSRRTWNKLNEETTRRHYKYLNTNDFFDDFIKVDSTHLSVGETAKVILKLLGKNWGQL